MSIQNLDVLSLQARLKSGDKLTLLDVREEMEFNYTHIKGSLLIPLSQLAERYREVDPNQEIVLICHHGVRSRSAAEFLKSMGFSKLFNLQGGIDAWARICDSSVLLY